MSATVERISVPINGIRNDETSDGDLPMPLELLIDDPEIIRALAEYPEGDARNQYAIEAMKIGLLALRHVGGHVSVDELRQEGNRVVCDLGKTFEQHRSTLQEQLESKLKEYFDPNSGRFEERIQSLIADDGKLPQLLKSYIDGENSVFARTLMTHVGRDSVLMKMLDPQQSTGLLTTLRNTVDEQLTKQRDNLVNEFSLDNKEGALSRLVNELTTSHGAIGKGLQDQIEVLMKEFSLNEEDSALSRLVSKVSQAQNTITNEFSLNSETSSLSRLKKELVTILDTHVKTNVEFQTEVKGALRELTARREEQERSTIHGATFQAAVFEYLYAQTQQQGDICDFTGDCVGSLPNCKIGDVLIKLGPDTTAAGAQITFEAKEEKKYSLSDALQEIEKARRNRQAQVGVFVFSKKTAPKELRSLKRFGDDLVVVWDVEDPFTDSFLLASLELARLMCICHQRRVDTESTDFLQLEQAINRVEKCAGNLAKISTYAKTVQNAGSKILKRAEVDRKSLEKQVKALRQKVQNVRAATIAS